MKFLRTVSTRRLLAIIVGVLSAIVAGAAIAVAAQGSGPVPPAKPLPNAVHTALAAPAPRGITARISFTNHLIDASNLQGSDPILSGATGRLWLSPGRGLRLELQSDNGDAQVVVNGRSFWIYDPSANTVYEGKLPADQGAGAGAKAKGKAAKAHAADRLPSVAAIQKQLSQLAQHANLSGAMPSDVAGRAAYTVRISPKHDGGLLGSGELAWDAIRGVPLRVAVYAQNNPTPVLELKATDISYGPVDRSAFTIRPPKTAKVVRINTAQATRDHAGAVKQLRGHKNKQEVTGASAVAKRLPFKLVAPAKLVGLPRQSVQLLDWGGHPAALVTYGQNLGGVAVIEQTTQKARAAGAGAAAGTAAKNAGDHRGLNLPTVSINRASGQELDTALGTVVRFDRGGVTYTVIGSVPAAAAEAAARAL